MKVAVVTVAVIGSRSFADARLMREVLEGLPIGRIVSGGARGADALAAEYAKARGIPLEEIRPDFRQHRAGAPMRRNWEIVQRADVLVAFWDGASKGTAATIVMARRAGKVVHAIPFVP